MATFVPDGPDFRAEILSREATASHQRHTVKTILDKASKYCEAAKTLEAAFVELVEQMKAVEHLLPLLSLYGPAIETITAVSSRLAAEVQQVFIQPVTTFYLTEHTDNQIKKKDCEKTASDYFALLDRHLGQAAAPVPETQIMALLNASDLARYRYLESLRNIEDRVQVELRDGSEHLFASLAKQLTRLGEQAKATVPPVSSVDEFHSDLEKRRERVREEVRNRMQGEKDLEQRLQSRKTLWKGGTAATDLTAKEGFLLRFLEGEKRVIGHAPDVWERRWVSLECGSLSEFSQWEKGAASSPTDGTHLLLGMVREARGTDRKNCFEVVTPQFTHVYQAVCAEERQEWISAIQNTIAELLMGQPAQSSRLNPSTDGTNPTARRAASLAPPSYNNLSQTKKRSAIPSMRADHLDLQLSSASSSQHSSPPTSAHSPAPPPSFAAPRPPSQQPPRGLAPPPPNTPSSSPSSLSRPTLPSAPPPRPPMAAGADGFHEQVRVLEGNDCCADCGAKDPDWVSINHGVLLCLECSGPHRSMGTHVSKVRSLTLDTQHWTAELKSLVLCIGNQRFNTVWEAFLHEKHYTKPIPGSERKAREAFITAKYETRSMMRPVANAESELLRLAQTNSVFDVLVALCSVARAVTPKDASGRTCLHLAVLARQAAVVELLVQQSFVDLNLQDNDGMTALHYAARADDVVAVKQLTSHQARADIKDKQGRRSLDIAVANKCQNVMPLLFQGLVDGAK